MKIVRIIAFIVLLPLTTTVYAGGGWPQSKGKGFFKLGQTAIRAGSFYTGSGEVIDITTLSIYTTSIYAEYGVTNRLTGIGYVPFFVRSTLNKVQRLSGIIDPGDRVNALGDADLGLKYALTVDKKIALAASIVFGVPLGTTDGGDSRILQTGDGEFNQLLMLEASRSFYPKPAYATLAVGINNRTNDFSEEFRSGVEIGYTGIKKVTAALKVYMVLSFYNGEGATADNGVFSNNTEYVSITPEINYDITDKAGASFSAGFAPFGRRILAAPNLGLGLYMKL